MENTGLPQIGSQIGPQIGEDLPELSALSTQDIPAAVREVAKPVSSAKPFKPNRLFWGLASLFGIAAVVVPLWLLRQSSQTAAVVPAPQEQAANSTASPATSPATDSAASPSSRQLLGHSPYAEAPQSELKPIAGYAAIRLRQAAAVKLEAMINAAAADGVGLVPLSGFRSIEEQNTLFFDVKAERGEVAAKRAVVSAPPGYSEHHTGYAIDIGDADAPSADLQFSFDQTAAYRWLKQNAAFYSFELSFPKNNPMGVSYEPWHWRFVGDRQSLETFYKARHSDGLSSESPRSDTSPTDGPGTGSTDGSTPQNSPVSRPTRTAN